MAISFLAAAYTALTVERNIPGTSIVLEGSQPVIKVGSKPLVGGFHTHTKALKCFELGESESLADGITIFLAMVRVLAP